MATSDSFVSYQKAREDFQIIFKDHIGEFSKQIVSGESGNYFIHSLLLFYLDIIGWLKQNNWFCNFSWSKLDQNAHLD